MFKRLEAGEAAEVVLDFEGVEVAARPGETVASALLAAGIDVFRKTPVSGRPRGAFCMMGVCFDCAMVIDGQANRQACQIVVRDGMTLALQAGPRDIDADGAI